MSEFEPADEYRDLFENAPCGYLTIGSDGRITKVNATLTAWTGFEADKFVGRRLHQFLNMAGRIYYETHIAPLLRMQGFFSEFALDFETAVGERLPMIANAAERRDADGTLLFTALVVIKATDRRRYEREAIAILKAQPDIHVVFTDIQMPGSMAGLKLARFVRNRWPPIKIVATSGLVRVEDDDLPTGSVFLPKPYRGAEVVAVLREFTGTA
jgi:PAS domain S-box-containing protein